MLAMLFPAGARVKIRQLSVLIAFFMLTVVGCAGLLDSTGGINQASDEVLAGVSLWQPVSTQRLQSVSAHDGEVLALKEISNKRSTQMLSAGADGKVLVWSLESGSGHLLRNVEGPLQLAAFGERHGLVAWTSGFTVHVSTLGGDPSSQGSPSARSWDLERLKTRFTSLAFHEGDSALLIAGADGRVYRWLFMAEPFATTLKDRDKTLERYIGHQTVVSQLQPLHTGRAFFSADWNGVLLAWLAYTADDQQGSFDRNLFGGRFFGGIGSYMAAQRTPDRGITSIGLSKDGKRLALGTDQGFVEVWEVRGFELIARSESHTGRVIGVSLNADGSQVVSLGRDGAIVAQRISPDPAYGIATSATRYRLTPFFKEEMPSARRIQFLPSGSVILATEQGQLGEIALGDSFAEVLKLPQEAPTPTNRMGDSDY